MSNQMRAQSPKNTEQLGRESPSAARRFWNWVRDETTGERTLYVRITKPDNGVLSKSDSNTFPYENRELVYSIKKYIEYNGEEQNVTVYWDVEEFLYAGSYRVDIFSDGTLIGSQSFNLD